ncbi:MAG: AMP-binding protein [Anaerolineae bacterium]|nr:AMP-binding protein [Anaerolineae bacterium]
MSSYLERPWIKHYDADVPHSLEPYPAIGAHQFLEKAAVEAPDRIALITPAKLPLLGWQKQTVTYGQLNQLSDALASGLVALGLKKGDRVALVLPNCVQMAISFFAVLKAGGVVAAANPTYPPPRMQFQINDCDAEIVITLSPFYTMLKQIQGKTKVRHIIVTNIKEYLSPSAALLFTLAKEKKEGHRIEELKNGDKWFQDVLKQNAGKKVDAKVNLSDIAAFQYTGGTTGVSKGAMLSHRAVVANVLQIQAWSNSLEKGGIGGITRADMLYLGAIPMFHVYGLIVLLCQAIASGSKIVLVPNPRDIDNLIAIIYQFRPNVFLGVPALYNAVVNHAKVKSGEVRLDSFMISSSGAAPLPPATKREYEQAGARRLNEAYGMSETSAAATSNPLLGNNKPGAVGMPLPDMDIRVVSLDDGVTDVPPGDLGEIVMAGPNLMSGYHGLPTETANALREQGGKVWMFSGDIGYMDADGYFYIVDRKKDMALIGGFNVYPNNVEKVLKEHPAILEVGVAAIPHPERIGEEALKAWVVLKPGMTITEQELVKHCEANLAGYEVPRRFSFIKELPKTLVGKTLRRELIQMEVSDQQAQSEDGKK